MLVLVIGGSGSGKSAYAEDCVVRLSGENSRYYLATMQIYGEEARARVERHRRLRKEKGFYTIEQQTSIEKALEKKKETDRPDAEASALLECMTNLAANEMFGEAGTSSCREVTDRIIAGMEELKKGFQNLVVVTGNVFEDGRRYEQSTMEYMRAMAEINRRLADMADAVIEVVVGIPVILKGEGI